VKHLRQRVEDRVFMRSSQKHYGISISQAHSTYRHTTEDTYLDPFDGERKGKEQMVWLIKKGDLLLSNKVKHVSLDFCRRFGIKDPRVFITKFVTCDEDIAPTRLSDIPQGRFSPNHTVPANIRTSSSNRYTPAL
jgi:hypothetical protein